LLPLVLLAFVKELPKDKYEIGNDLAVINFNEGRYFALVDNSASRTGFMDLFSLKKLGLTAYLDYIYSKIIVFKDINNHWSK
jgi:hypothetical protein